jgi:hypothetical protein
MGIHILIQSIHTFDDHPDWDYLREVNDRHFPGLISKVEVVRLHLDGVDDNSFYNKYFRPKNIKEVRDLIDNTNWENKSRYHKLLNLLEEDDDYFLKFSW